jgi:hypothetical protein
MSPKHFRLSLDTSYKKNCFYIALTDMSVFIFTSIILGLFLLTKIITATAFLYRLQLPKHSLPGRITLILPLSGRCPTLETLIKSLTTQSLQPCRLIIAVESKNDPAHDRAQKLADQTSFPIEVITAGFANHCAQKCWNQIAALRQLDDLDDAIIMLDADIDPQPSWLSLLATPILEGKADVVTGYRWQRIVRNSMTEHLVAAIDRGIAILPSIDQARLTWGGSIALSRRAINALNLPVLLSSTLSDDCTIGEHAGRMRLRVLNRRVLRVPSPCCNNFASAWNFGRRQYQIIRLYRIGLWRLAAATLTFRLCAWIILFIGIFSFPKLMTAYLLLSLLCLSATVQQQRIASRLGLSDDIPVKLGQLTVSLLEPLITLIHWSMIAAAYYTDTITWGHVRYKINKNGGIEVQERKIWQSQ